MLNMDEEAFRKLINVQKGEEADLQGSGDQETDGVD